MEGITISKIIDIIAAEVALDPKMIHEEDLLCDCDADSQDVFNILPQWRKHSKSSILRKIRLKCQWMRR